MKRPLILFLGVLLLGGAYLILRGGGASKELVEPTASSDNPVLQTPAEDLEVSSNKRTQDGYDDLSSQFITSYGNEESSGLDDIRELRALFDSYFLLVKAPNALRVGDNKSVTASLMGENPYRLRVVSPSSPWINQNGELVDRWKSPLFFHAIDEKKVGIRSAGPDRKMWTQDDLLDGPNAEMMK